MKNILVWGFYDQGNIGDDLMAMMFAKLVTDLGHKATICTSNRNFEKLGFEICDAIESARPDVIVLGGGAFFKKGGHHNSNIERKISQLADFVESTGTPVYGMSLGSDGIDRIAEASDARRRVASAPSFLGTTVRLRHDLDLGLANTAFLNDIVICSAYFAQISDKSSAFSKPIERVLINLSRRSVLQLPKILCANWNRKVSFFKAHDSQLKTGGEITLPLYKIALSDNFWDGIKALAESESIYSSKLHPGIISMSFGNRFHSVAPRPKTIYFLEQSQDNLKNLFEIESQKRIWREYSAHLKKIILKNA